MDAVHRHRQGMLRLPLRAAIFVALVCGAILGISAWREWTAREAVLKIAEVETANLARSLTQHAEDSFDLLDASILGVATRLEADGLNPKTIATLHKIMVTRKAHLDRLHFLVICDENGNWISSSGATGGNLDDRDYFQYHKHSASNDVFVGRPVKGKTDGKWVTTVSRRFNHPDGSFAGVVVATITASYFGDFYSQFDVGAGGSLSLLSTDGITMARMPDHNNVGRDISNGPFFRGTRSSGPSGVYYFRSLIDGTPRLGFYQRSSRYPFTVLATKSVDEVLAPWRHQAIGRMSFVLGLVVLIAIIGLHLVRQLFRGRRMAMALAAKETNFRVLAEGSSDMVTRIGLDERIQYASPSSVRIVGWRPDQLEGTPALAGVNAADLPGVEQTVALLKRGNTEEARVNYRTRHREKAEVWLESTLRVTRTVDGVVDGVVAISRDVTEQKGLEERLEALATEDGLTGLANRRHFDERLQEEWARASRSGSALSLLMIDIDHFKKFNDAYGHPAGDRCLSAIAGILAAEARRITDIAARYGGEEFAMLLPDTDIAGCARIGKRIHRAIRQAGISHTLNQPCGLVTASVGGATCWPGAEGAAGSASLVEAADRALYAAKGGGRDRLVLAGEVVTLFPIVSAQR